VGVDELKRILEDEGIALPLFDFGQGYKDMAPAVSAMETGDAGREAPRRIRQALPFITPFRVE
jgi:hypothetical protein